MDDFEVKLLDDIQYENHDLTNMYTFYKGYVDKIISYNGAIIKGKEINLSPDEIRDITNEMEYINKEIQNLRKKLKKETQPNKIVEINNRIRDNLFKEEELIEKLK